MYITGSKDTDINMMLYLEDEDLLNISLVNRHLRNIYKSQEFWKLKVKSKFVKDFHHKSIYLDWKEWYQKICRIFVFVTAANCPYSQKFRSTHWDQLKSSLKGRVVKIINIEVPYLTHPIPHTIVDIPDDFQRFVIWYPSFFLVNEKSWKKNQKLSRSNISIFNGLIKNNTLQYDKIDPKNNTHDTLLQWVNYIY